MRAIFFGPLRPPDFDASSVVNERDSLSNGVARSKQRDSPCQRGGRCQRRYLVLTRYQSLEVTGQARTNRRRVGLFYSFLTREGQDRVARSLGAEMVKLVLHFNGNISLLATNGQGWQ